MDDSAIHTISAAGVTASLDLSLGRIARFQVQSGGDWLSPFHTVPWIEAPEDSFPDGTAPHLKRMSIDFFCAPFGRSDQEPAPAHGWPANSRWSLIGEEKLPGGVCARFLLDRPVMGARLIKSLTLRDGHPFLYQSHRFEGGEGAISVAYHPMVSLPHGGSVSFSPKLWTETPDEPLEADPARGRSVLAYPARSENPRAFPLAGGGEADLLTYPVADTHEDLVMAVENPANPLGWTVVARHGTADAAIVLKSPAVLPQTVFWFSNGGRFYPPWNGRHRAVLGIEDAATYFADGHKASVEENPLNRRSIPTSISLGDPIEVRSVIGAFRPALAGQPVKRVEAEAGRLLVEAVDGSIAALPFDDSFLDDRGSGAPPQRQDGGSSSSGEA